jgi:hypothetical protein
MKTLLVTFSIVIPVPDEDESQPVTTTDTIIWALQDAINQHLADLPASLGLYSTRTLQLDHPQVNSGQCANCGAWTTDVEKPKPVSGISIGASIGDKLFCDECLPPDHPHAF